MSTPQFLGLFGAVCLVIVVLMWLAILADEFRRHWKLRRQRGIRSAWRAWRGEDA